MAKAFWDETFQIWFVVWPKGFTLTKHEHVARWQVEVRTGKINAIL